MTRDIRKTVGRDRFILVHYHIFKNAGSSLDFALRRSFGDALADFHGDHADAVLRAEDLAALLASDEGLRAVSSHHLRYPVPEVAGLIVFDACLIRHPLARIRSMYHYGLRLGEADWLGALACRKGGAGFIAHLLEHMPHMVCDSQVNLIAQAGAFRRPPDAHDAAVAIEAMRLAALPGLVERFDESMVAAEYFLRPAFPDIDLAYIAQNISNPEGVSAGRGSGLLDACRSAWGDAAFDAVLDANRQDLQLWQAVSSELDRRLALVPGLHERLAAYRQRCLQLA